VQKWFAKRFLTGLIQVTQLSQTFIGKHLPSIQQ